MSTIHTKFLDKSFIHSIQLIDSLRNIINRSYVDFDDLKYLLNQLKGLMNVDFERLIMLLTKFTDEKNDSFIKNIEDELSMIEKIYHGIFNTIYIVDDEFLYQYPSETVLHILSVSEFNNKQRDIVSINHFLSKVLDSKSNIYATVNNRQVNLNFFNTEILNKLPLSFRIETVEVFTNQVELKNIFQILQFLLDIKKYRKGDQVYFMKSTWTSNGKKLKWRQDSFDKIIDNTSYTKHYVDLVSDDEIIYRLVEGPPKLSTSITKKFKKRDKEWKEVKILQRLIG